MTKRTLISWLASGGLALAMLVPSVAIASPHRDEERSSRVVDARHFNRGDRYAPVRRGDWNGRRDGWNELRRPVRAGHGFSRERSRAFRYWDRDDRR